MESVAYILDIPFASSPYPMWVYDRETRAFLEVNDAAVAAYGFTREEFMKMTLLEIRPTEDIPEFLRQTDHPRPMVRVLRRNGGIKRKQGRSFQSSSRAGN